MDDAIKQKLLNQSGNTLKEGVLNPDVFCITWEQTPGRGSVEISQEEVIENARKAAASGKIHAISLTDNPSGLPAMSPEMFSAEIKKQESNRWCILLCATRTVTNARVYYMVYHLRM
jgi:hypothetical protein